MQIYIAFIASVVVLFNNGCTESTQVQPKKEVMIVSLNKQVKELGAKDKQLIYRSIQDDINRYNEDGDEAYENGYNYDAVKNYELVNFYEGYSYVSQKKIKKIKKLSKQRSIIHYKKGVKYTNSNKKRAIAEFNTVMMNNPEYKDTQKKLIVLNSDRDMKIFVNSLESTLHTKMLNCDGNINELKDINIKLEELLKYDYNNSVAFKSKDVLKEYNGVLVKNAISLYDDSKIRESEIKFKQILNIYPNDDVALDYMSKIKVKKSIQSNLKLAQKALNKKEYIKSIKYAYNVLKIDRNNKKAKNIIQKANKEARKKVAILVNDGKKQYNNRKLDESKRSFQEALRIDPLCDEALIYSKKIDRQLQTIQSLQ